MRKYLIAGLLLWLPLAITIWVLLSVLGLLDSMFAALVAALKLVSPDSADHALDQLTHIPGLSVIVMVAGLLLSGVVVTNVVGQWAVTQWDRLMSHIPIVKSIYSSVKQVSDTLFSSSGNAFREAVLVQYPRAGSWTIAFVTGKPGGEVADLLSAEHLSLYVPTTPNPTSGFLLMVPRADVMPLGMSVDEALKYIISMGVVSPGAHPALPASPQPDAALAGPDNRNLRG